MGRANLSKSNLFLLELIIVILFFSVCTAVCVGLFVQARQISQNSTALSDAVLLAQSAAECFKADSLESLPLQDGKAYFDKDTAPCGQDAAVYILELTENMDSDIATADICVTFGGEQIFELTTARAVGGEQQ